MNFNEFETFVKILFLNTFLECLLKILHEKKVFLKLLYLISTTEEQKFHLQNNELLQKKLWVGCSSGARARKESCVCVFARSNVPEKTGLN